MTPVLEKVAVPSGTSGLDVQLVPSTHSPVAPVQVPSVAWAETTPSAVVASNIASDWRATDRSPRPAGDVRMAGPEMTCFAIRIESGVPFALISVGKVPGRSQDSTQTLASAMFSWLDSGLQRAPGQFVTSGRCGVCYFRERGRLATWRPGIAAKFP